MLYTPGQRPKSPHACSRRRRQQQKTTRLYIPTYVRTIRTIRVYTYLRVLIQRALAYIHTMKVPRHFSGFFANKRTRAARAPLDFLVSCKRALARIKAPRAHVRRRRGALSAVIVRENTHTLHATAAPV